MTITVGTKIKVTNTKYPSRVPNGSIMTVTNHIFDGTVDATVDGGDGFEWCMEAGTYEVLESDTTQVGTLAELEVNVGDVVELVKHGSDALRNNTPPKGNRFEINNDLEASPITHIHLGNYTRGYTAIFRIISRATQISPQPTLFGELTDAEQAELLLAHHRGERIECLSVTNWYECLSVVWDDDCAYRIAPPKPVVETTTGYLKANKHGKWIGSESPYTMTHSITFDTIDGVPDTGSIKMVEV